MANFVCDICGGKITVQSGGVGICGQCGMEYSNERLREMAGAVNVCAPAESKKTTTEINQENVKVKNYLSLARNELNAGLSRDVEKALEYCDKALEIDINNFDAWYIKAQLEISSMQFSTALRYGVDLYHMKNVSEEQKKKAVAIIKEAVDRWLGSYMGTAWSLIIPDIACLVDVEDGKIYEDVAKKALKGLHEKLQNASKRVSEFVAKEYIWKTEYSAHSDGDFVLREVKSVVDTMSKIPEKMYVRLAKPMVKEYEEALYTYNRLKDLEYDNGNYLQDKKKKDPSCATVGKKISQKISDLEDIERAEKKRLEEIARQDRLKKAAAYWEKHPEEKKQLESELERISKDWAAAEEGLNEFLEENPKENEIEEQILFYKKELKELSLFKIKEKKEVKERIKEFEKKLVEAQDEFMQRKQAQIIKVDEFEKMYKKVSKKLECPQ